LDDPRRSGVEALQLLVKLQVSEVVVVPALASHLHLDKQQQLVSLHSHLHSEHQVLLERRSQHLGIHHNPPRSPPLRKARGMQHQLLGSPRDRRLSAELKLLPHRLSPSLRRLPRAVASVSHRH
jgi:hypothetical protein